MHDRSIAKFWFLISALVALSPLTVHADYAATVLADNPVAYWRLGETEGPTAADASGNGNDATEEGTVAFGQGSLIPPDADTSVGVVGNNRLATAPFEKFGATGFSAECWVKLNAAPNGFGQIFGDGEGGGDFNMMLYTGGAGFVRAHLQTDAGVVAADSPDSIVDGKFHHIVSTWDAASGDLNLYIDTVLVASLNHGGAPVNTDNPIYIGKDNREPGRFDGLIDEVALYDKPLSEARIEAHYNEVTQPAENYQAEVLADSPVGYWRLGEAEGPALADISGNNRNGTEEGTVSYGEASLIPPDADTAIRVGGDNRVFIDGFEKFGATGFSAECWVKLDAAPGGFGQIFGDGEGGGDFNMMLYTGGGGFVRAHLQTDAGVVAADSPGTIADDRLHHIVSTWDAATGDLNLYIDSVMVASVNHGGTTVNTDNPLWIGKDNREPGRFSGSIDEVAFYDFPLSPGRIAAHYGQVEIPPPPPAEPHPDPGNLADLPDGLAHYNDFDEASGPSNEFTLNFAYDRVGSADGTFEGGSGRTDGLIGRGAATFDNVVGSGINVGADGFETTAGIAIEAVIMPAWSGAGGDYDEIFRKEDGGNRILFSFQNDQFSAGANPPVAANIPVLSFGLNVGGYGELDLPLDGSVAGVSLDGLKDGAPHHVVANYDSATGEKSIWVDGVKAWSVMLPAGTEIASGGGTPAYIGSTNGGGEPFTGTIDEFTFWNRSLSADEIADHSAAVALGRNFFQGTDVAETYAAEIALDNPIAYWRLGDDGPDTAIDSSGNGHDATVEEGAVEFGQDSLIPPDTDKSIALNRDRLFVDGFDKIDTGFTVEFWTQIDSATGGFANLVGDGDGGLNFMLMVYMTPGGNVRPHVQTDSGFGSLDSLDFIADGQLHHVVSTWDQASGEMLLYLDGEVADVNISAGSFPTEGEAINDENPIFIGRDNREAGWDGLIDEVAFYDYALAPERIAAHFARVDRGNVVVNQPHPDPGNLAEAPAQLRHFIDFDEAAGPVEGRTLNFAYDRVGDIEGRFQGSAERVPGLVGVGAAAFDNTGGTGINLGSDGFETTTGITVEMIFQSEWSGGGGDYDEFFRKEDGGNRILLSYQNDGNNGGANPPVDPGPVLSFGLNVDGAYGELDMPLDGSNAAGLTVEDIADGMTHHIAATYDSASGDKTIWIDGVKAWTVNLGEGAEITSGGGAAAWIGSTGGGEPFTGIIDEFAFWERALTEEEIAIHAANGLAGESILAPGGQGVGFVVTEFIFNAETFELGVTFNSAPAATYALEFSLDLKTWTEIEDSITSGGAETSITADFTPFIPDGDPTSDDEAYFRMRRAE